MQMWSNKVYKRVKFHNHNAIYEYFTDHNNVNIGAFVHKQNTSQLEYFDNGMRQRSKIWYVYVHVR